MSDTNQIHDAVKERYGAIAARADLAVPVTSAACCGPENTAGCDCSAALYDQQLLEGLPVDVTGLSLGCGDPVTIAGLQPGETVLDLGSGGGIDCFLAARQVGPTGTVIGVDMTPEMLAKANANKTRMGVHNVEFREGRIETLPVAENSIDVVISNCVINLSPDKAAVFNEVYRVLKPGGRVSISDIVTEGEFSSEVRADLDRWAECVSSAVEAEAYIALMHAVGFEDIRIVDRQSAEPIIVRQPGMPRIFSARITGRKPA